MHLMHLLSRTVQPFKGKQNLAHVVPLFTCGLASLDLDLGRWSLWRRLNVPFCHPDCCESWWILLQQHLQDTSSSIRSVCMKQQIYMGWRGTPNAITGKVTLVSPKMYLVFEVLKSQCCKTQKPVQCQICAQDRHSEGANTRGLRWSSDIPNPCKTKTPLQNISICTASRGNAIIPSEVVPCKALRHINIGTHKENEAKLDHWVLSLRDITHEKAIQYSGWWLQQTPSSAVLQC